MIDSKLLKFPKVIRIEPSSHCNLKCIHCPTGTVDMKRDVMDENTFRLIIENIENYKANIEVAVLYHGGEPLINKEFGNMVKELKRLGIAKIKTVSNGMLLEKEKIEELIESGLDEIEFSLDGTSAYENNLIRRNCDYDCVVKNIKNLIKIKKELNTIYPEIFISTTQFFDIQNKDINDCKIPNYLLEEFKEELIKKDLIGFKSTYAMRWPDMNIVEEMIDLTEIISEKEDLNYCDHIINTITIRSNGDVVPCCYDLTGKIVLGNIKKQSLIDIWNGDLYKKLRLSIENRDFSSLCNCCNVVKQNKKIYLQLKGV